MSSLGLKKKNSINIEPRDEQKEREGKKGRGGEKRKNFKINEVKSRNFCPSNSLCTQLPNPPQYHHPPKISIWWWWWADKIPTVVDGCGEEEGIYLHHQHHQIQRMDKSGSGGQGKTEACPVVIFFRECSVLCQFMVNRHKCAMVKRSGKRRRPMMYCVRGWSWR